MAADVEHEMTKDQLLAAYLNVAYFDEQRLRHPGGGASATSAPARRS